MFVAMASPCEVLMGCKSISEAEKLASLAFSEARRIEYKFSRYRQDNIVYQINNSRGEPVHLDEESAQLLGYASECYKLSDGMFDVTSGVLRRAWRFDGQEAKPDKEKIKSLLELVGWSKVEYAAHEIRLREGMEIDLGGLGKEYAVDKVVVMLQQASSCPVMVNFGGDLRAVSLDEADDPWVLGIEDPEEEDEAIGEIKIRDGAVATSGDARRFCTYMGERLGHILNPKTGWPAKHAPRSVTVVADFCMVAGFLATMSILHGKNAEKFLKTQDVVYHCVR